jgi:hypothetical protein
MRFFIVFFSLFFSITAIAQTEVSLPSINMGVGVGPSYGLMGVKAVLGKNDSGMVIGLGSFMGEVFAYSYGYQMTIESFYLNLVMGNVIAVKINNNPIEALKGGGLFLGKMFNFGSGNFYIDVSVGHTFGVEKTSYYEREFSNDGFSFNLGLNYRLFNK